MFCYAQRYALLCHVMFLLYFAIFCYAFAMFLLCFAIRCYVPPFTSHVATE